MRVLLVNGRLSDRGGADRWLLSVVARLQGHVETLLAVGRADPALPGAERRRVGAWCRVEGLDRRGFGRSPRAVTARLGETIDRFAPDVVHANEVTDPALLGAIAACGRSVMTVQDHRYFCPGRGKVDLDDRPCRERMGEACARCFENVTHGRRMIRLTRRRLAAVVRMNRVTVLSRYMQSELTAAGVPADRLVYLPPFVDNFAAAPEGSAARGRFHLMAGRLSHQKGVRVALAAARMLRGGLPLVVAGEGSLAREVEEQARMAGSPVRFVGWADRGQLGALLAGARSLWLPSLWAEPFGIVGIEALAHGVPVIASDIGGVRDWLIDGQTGLLVEAGSSEQLAAAADRLARFPDLAHSLRQGARLHVARHFDPVASMTSLLRLYSEVASEGTWLGPSGR